MSKKTGLCALLSERDMSVETLYVYALWEFGVVDIHEGITLQFGWARECTER